MIERELIKTYTFSSYVIGSLQQSYAQGLFDDDEGTEISEMQSIINAKYDFIDSFSNHYKDEFVASRILHINIVSIEEYLQVCCNRFESLLKSLDIKTVIIILNSKCDWFQQKNNYKPVKKAMSRLGEIVGRKNYLGAFEVDVDSLKQMFDIVFWLGRCNASLPDIHIISEESKISFMICKYGNIHVEIYSDEMAKKFHKEYLNLGFKIIESEEEFLSNEIGGRKILT